MTRRAADEPKSPADLPVAVGTCLLAIGVTALYWAGRNIEPLTMSSAAFWRQPWRLVTSALPHAHYREGGFVGIFHIVFNVAWTYRFGSVIEARYGSRSTLLLFLLLAAGSSAAEFAIFRGGIGLSGVGFGLWGFLWSLSRNTNDLDDVVDRRTNVTFVGWFFFCIASTYFHVMAIANVAHGMGAVLGALAAQAVSARSKTRRSLFAAGTALTFAACLAGGSVLRPIVNVDGYAREMAATAFDLVETDPARAAELYRKAFAKEPSNPNYCYNLGVALARSGHRDEAEKLYARACELSHGSDDRYCR